MMRSTFSLFCVALLTLFAGKAAAELNITLPFGNVTAAGFFNVTNDPHSILTNCVADPTSNCSFAVSSTVTCPTDADCCSNATFGAVQTCEQCMFNQLISLNVEPSDSRIGQAAALTAYSTACAAVNLTVLKNLTTLSDPSNWDGPFGQGLTTGTTVISVIVAAVLGVGLITVVNTM